MTYLRVTNWRCIEDLELRLARINVFIGRNSTGKSSLAYAIYFASKSRSLDPGFLLAQLYGHGFDKIARMVENKPRFPISIRIDDSEFSVRPMASAEPEKMQFDIARPSRSPWVDEYLLPSQRIDYVRVMMFLPRMIGGLRAGPEATIMGSLIGGLFEMFKTLPIFPPFGIFSLDYTRALTGLRLEFVAGELGGENIGSYIVKIHPLFSLMQILTRDPYVDLELPAELSPDGVIDFGIFDSMTKRVPENSLIVIEEPEIHKNPLTIMRFTRQMVERVLDKKLTLIMTTHSDIPLTTMAKLAAEGMLKPDDVKIYYLTRDPWTKASEIKLYADGTLDSLPDTEELIIHLF